MVKGFKKIKCPTCQEIHIVGSPLRLYKCVCGEVVDCKACLVKVAPEA